MSQANFPILSPDLQVSFYYKLKNIKDVYFQEALAKVMRNANISQVDKELSSLVSNESLQKLASFSLRGETVFPIPSILCANPFLLGYYRLLLGISQKEFYTRGPFGRFRMMEEKGLITKAANAKIAEFCTSLIATTEIFVKEVDHFDLQMLTDLQLLTVGPQFRGSKNNEYGNVATQQVFSLIKDMAKHYITASTLVSMELRNDSGRIVSIHFASDPDIEITEELTTQRGLISIEIKGGKDFSNIHNRIGEAEKSHQKARLRGHREFITIINVDISYDVLKSESPTTSHFFHLDKISDRFSVEHAKFKDILSSAMGVSI